jgi:hypothetical protein
MIERRILPLLREALKEEPANDPDRHFANSLLQAAELYTLKPEVFNDTTLTEREKNAIDLGVRVATYMQKFSPDDDLIDVVPATSTSINDDEWRMFMGTFTIHQRRFITMSLRYLRSYSRRYPQEIKKVADVPGFDFRPGKVLGIGRISAMFLKEAFSGPQNTQETL